MEQKLIDVKIAEYEKQRQNAIAQSQDYANLALRLEGAIYALQELKQSTADSVSAPAAPAAIPPLPVAAA